jgi:DNA invertase Pin-like site-specific DNA recombinase
VVTELECVGGSAAALGRVLERLRKAGAGFIALDADIDTTTREGAMAAALLVAVTRTERERRVREGGNGRHHVRPPGGAQMN